MSIERRQRLENIVIRFGKDGAAYAHRQDITWLMEDGVSDLGSDKYMPPEPAKISDLAELIGEASARVLVESQALQIALADAKRALKAAEARAHAATEGWRTGD